MSRPAFPEPANCGACDYGSTPMKWNSRLRGWVCSECGNVHIVPDSIEIETLWGPMEE